MSSVAVLQGATDAFAVLRHDNREPVGDYRCMSVCSRGSIVHQVSGGIVALTSGAVGSGAVIVGIIEQNVLASTEPSITFGYNAQQHTGTITGDKVAIWRHGKFYMTRVTGSVALGDLLYPADSGKVSATQTSGSPAIGVCVKANTASDGPIEMEMSLVGRPNLA